MTDAVILRTAFAAYPHVQALRAGAIASERVAFHFEDIPNITRAFRRMVRTLDFDLCEIALTTLAQAIAYGKPLIGLPVVVMRGFHHGALVCPVGSPLQGPADLRGILRDEYGVDHSDITWSPRRTRTSPSTPIRQMCSASRRVRICGRCCWQARSTPGSPWPGWRPARSGR